MAADGSPHFSPLEAGNSRRRRLSAENDPATFWRALHDSEYLRFTFVRDPYARVVSAFLDKIDSGRHLRFKKMLGFAPDDRVLFVDFLRRVSGQEIVKMNRHWRPQSALISPKVKLDFIGRFEQFEDDFAKLLERLGVEESAVRHKREHQTSANHHLDLIGIEEKALIDRIYEEDFKRFGYPMRVDRL
jgi:hypothetical protein